ncbi:MAG: hypothetical protein COW88_00565 [Candidatus Lloydbacteria bacterium CG22_combo_CG10-13_8_21_14_all_47_15]|uniref:Phenylacetate--CoA ligase n=1 Tax=Candidatus Lloydbacteria bacterium CG22_combo_CG10-13_8_21_14_all_47_15 TaxID=1974635 RepID=A0A2H0CVE9_9BACT|nr:MAG: hypothetical protein COW88_00565 [Candidatus Lloydbacteria bacterium CG22_combo_CG10-13_8_21_14_all_47_15]
MKHPVTQFKNADEYGKALQKKGELFWQTRGESMALELFKEAAQRVPAYKHFLAKNRTRAASIRTIKDFSQIPLVSKKNYLMEYPLEKLAWDGKLQDATMVSMSSGSSGTPFFWPRSVAQEEEAIYSHEAFLKTNFDIDKKSTLFIVTFAMGMWVAGTITYKSVQDIAGRYPLTVLTPGIDKNETLRIIQAFGGKYDQIIIAGYPPFVKDIIDAASSQHMTLKKYNIKFLFAAEPVNERWRDYLYKKVGSTKPLRDSLNIYGTADALILGHETPLSLFIKRTARKHSALEKDVFGDTNREPSLVQYNPMFRYFEENDGHLIFSAYSGLPLVRYDISDDGKIISYAGMKMLFKKNGIDLEKEAERAGIADTIWKLPFAIVFGKSDHTTFLYGINIYPENIRDGLMKNGIQNAITGKFTAFSKTDNRHNQYLEVHIELRDGRRPERALSRTIANTLVTTLCDTNLEYKRLHREIGKRARPHVLLYPYGDTRFFKTGAKQKWGIAQKK